MNTTTPPSIEIRKTVINGVVTIATAVITLAGVHVAHRPAPPDCLAYIETIADVHEVLDLDLVDALAGARYRHTCRATAPPDP